MRDVYEVLRAKEILIEQLRREIEALRLAAPLLSEDRDEDRDNGALADAPGTRTEPDAQSVRSIKRSGRVRLPKEADRERAVVTEDEAAGAAQRISGRLRRLARPVLDAVNSMAS
jgi:hypothetical protein